MGAANAKSEFSFYNNVKLHKCSEIQDKEQETIHYYQYLSGLTMDLDVVNNPEKYRKKVSCIQPKCNCSKKKVTLNIYKQVAISKRRFKPGMTYEYKTRRDVFTRNGFNWWIHEITRSTWTVDNEFDVFISGLMPGIVFYDGVFIRKIANKMLQEVDFNSARMIARPDFTRFLKTFIEYAVELKDNSVVVNEISV